MTLAFGWKNDSVAAQYNRYAPPAAEQALRILARLKGILSLPDQQNFPGVFQFDVQQCIIQLDLELPTSHVTCLRRKLF